MLKYIYKLFNPGIQKLFLEYPVDMKPRYGYGQAPHQELYRIINQNRQMYKSLLQEVLRHKSTFFEINTKEIEKDPLNPFWNNGFLPGLDMVTIYTLIVHFKPKRYFEIGSGNSTKIAWQAKNHHSRHTKITSVDPMPRSEIDSLADEVIRKPFEQIDLDDILNLQENDILFIDNSHRILPNSDAMVFFMEVLPRLNKGVIVHIHDIFLPYDYPQEMCDRFYSEQYGLAFFLLSNPGKYQTLLPNYFISQDPELSEICNPIWEHKNLHGVEKHGGSYWIKIAE